MTRCTRCQRALKRARPSGMGPVCELAVLGPPSRNLTRAQRKGRARVATEAVAHPDQMELEFA